jgi:hypothetical protein
MSNVERSRATEEPPTVLITLGTGDEAAFPHRPAGHVRVAIDGTDGRSEAESLVALRNAVFAQVRRMYGPNVHVSVNVGDAPGDACQSARIQPDPEVAILEAIAAIRDAHARTPLERTSAVRVVLPDGIVLDGATGVPDEVSLFESADGRLALLVDGWAVTGFEALVGWRLVPDVRALLAGETIPTHTRWVHDGAVLMVWIDGSGLLAGAGSSGDGVVADPNADNGLPPPPSHGTVGAALSVTASPWDTVWRRVATVTRAGEVGHVDDLSPRCRRILDLPPTVSPDAVPTPVRPTRMRRRN